MSLVTDRAELWWIISWWFPAPLRDITSSVQAEALNPRPRMVPSKDPSPPTQLRTTGRRAKASGRGRDATVRGRCPSQALWMFWETSALLKLGSEFETLEPRKFCLSEGLAARSR